MLERHSSLFKPTEIGGVEIENRYFMAPMGPFGLTDANGVLTQRGIDYYVERAKGGAGLIMTGICVVNDDIEKMLRPSVLFATANPLLFMQSMTQVADRIHAYGSKIFLQLTAGFGRAAHPLFASTYVAPSEVENRYNPAIRHRALTTKEVETIVDSFARAAALAKRCDIDGVEIHAVHEGYLLDQFAMKIFNQRTDKYGGSLENRLRFAAEIVQAIKKSCGREFPVSLRYTVKHFMKGIRQGAVPGEEFKELGRDLPEGLEAARLLVAAGYDALNVDLGCYDSHYWSHPPVYFRDGMYLEHARKVKEVINVPVLVAGRMDDPDLAADAVRSGKVDMVGLGRPSLADPYLPRKVRQGRPEKIRHCISCCYGCGTRISTTATLSCAINPQCGKESVNIIKPASTRKKVMVVGGGPAGMEAARVCAARGHEVTLFEKEERLGGNLFPAGQADFKRHDHQLIRWYESELAESGVRVRLGTEVTEETIRQSGYDSLILALGSAPLLPDIPGKDLPHVFTAVEVLLDIGKVRGKVVIIGGGQVGCETGIWLAQKGIQTAIIELAPEIMGGPEKYAPVIYDMTLDLINFLRIDLRTAREVKEITRKGVSVLFGDKAEFMEADTVVLAMGYRPVTSLYTAAAKLAGDVYLIGDARKVGNVGTSIQDAFEVANNI